MDCLPKPQVIVTHESDLDGLLSGLLLQKLALQLFGDVVPLEAYHYQNWKQRELQESSAWVADLALEGRMDRPDWVIIDHHTTATTPKQAHFIHDVTKSAGRLCYELCCQHGLQSPPLDRLVHLNDVADLFLENDPDFVLANDYANLVKVYQFWNLHALIDGQAERILDHPLLQVMEVKRRVEDPLGLEWSRKNIVELSPTVGFVETVLGNSNLILHHLLEQGISRFPILITLFRRNNGVVVASIRSRNGQAIKLAEQLRGGGHANAAGAALPRSVRTIADAVVYLRQLLNPAKAKPLNSLEDLFDTLETPQ